MVGNKIKKSHKKAAKSKCSSLPNKTNNQDSQIIEGLSKPEDPKPEDPKPDVEVKIEALETLPPVNDPIAQP